jgi:O-antigen/teichoic acid export membrane protein
MPERRAARGTVQLVMSQACLFVSGYVITILLARGLGPADYGIYGVILSILSWVEQSSRFGIASATAKLIAEDQRQAPAVAQTAWVLGACLLVVVFAVFWSAAPLLARLFQLPEGVSLLRLAALDIPVYGMYFIYRGVSQGRREFATLSLAGASYGLSKVAGVFGLYALTLSIQGALVVNMLASMVALVFIASRTPIKPSQWHPTRIPRLLPVALPFALGGLIANVLYHLDVLSLRILLSEDMPHAIGVYVAASYVAKAPQLGVLAVTQVLFSSLARAIGTQDMPLARRYVQGALRFLWVVSLPVSILIAFEAEDIMTLLYSSQYSSGGPVLRVTVFGWSLFAFLVTFLTILQARGEIYLSSGLGLSLTMAMAFLSVVLVPIYGVLGAAWAMLMTMGMGTLVSGVFVYRRFGWLMRPSTLLKGVMATASMAIVGSQVPGSAFLLPLRYVSLLALYVVVMVILGELRREDLQPFALWRRKVR